MGAAATKKTLILPSFSMLKETRESGHLSDQRRDMQSGLHFLEEVLSLKL